MTSVKQELTSNENRQLIDYNPETGEMYWKIRHGEHSKSWNSRYAKTKAFNVSATEGYLKGKIKKKNYSAHRIAWLYYYGSFPNGELDHINHDRTDNRIKNLRCVTPSENMKNQKFRCTNTSGTMGVLWDKTRQRWRAQIVSHGKCYNLGRFKNYEDAVAARKKAEKELNFHENHGKKVNTNVRRMAA